MEKYHYPVNGAAGLVGNLWAESGVLPNRIEGSKQATPMRAPNFAKVLRDFTAEQVMSRVREKQGPKFAGIGLAQWTTRDRRAGLFQYIFEGQRLGAAILYNMDAQVDYLVAELKSKYGRVDSVLRNASTSVESASDEVIYSYERPGSIMGPKDANGRRSRLPRDNTAVQKMFARRREYSRNALRVYRAADPDRLELIA